LLRGVWLLEAAKINPVWVRGSTVLLMQHHYHPPLYKQALSFPYHFKSTMSRIQRFLNLLTKGRVPAPIATR
jgi:hypothetical protein